MKWLTRAFVVWVLIEAFFDSQVLTYAFIGYVLGMLDRHYEWGITDTIINLFTF